MVATGQDDDPEYEVEIEGKPAKVKLSELRAGYMKDADYRRKTAQAAELTRNAQAEVERVQRERQEAITRIDSIADAMFQELVGDEQKLASLLDEDPVAYLRVKQQMEHKAQMLQQAALKRQELVGAQAKERERELQRYVQSEQEKLNEKVREWSDPKVKQAEVEAITRYLRDNVGYSDDELGQLYDHRALLVARDAMRYRAQQAVKQKQAKQTPSQTLRPGAAKDGNPNQQQALKEATARLRKTGSEEDAMAVLRLKRAS